MCVCMTMKGISAKHLSKRPENHSLLEILKTNINRRPTSKSSSSAYTATYTAIPYVEFSPSAGRTDLVNEMIYNASRQGLDLLEILKTHCIKAHGRSISLDFLFVCEFPKRLCADIVYNDTETQKMHIYTRHKDT